MPALHLIAALVLAASPVEGMTAEEPIDVIVRWEVGAEMYARLKCDRVGLTLVELRGSGGLFRCKPSRVQFAEELRGLPRIESVYVGVPCERFVVAWRGLFGRDAEDAVGSLKHNGIRILHRGETLPFAVCEGPLTAEVQETLTYMKRHIEYFEPEYVEPPKEAE